ncbi:MAG: OmpA family protein [Pseudomonadota bacterium]|nr:OmpA family protein [Pseudomonadota bacterium]
MRLAAITFLTAALVAAVASAQSTITLEDFDLPAAGSSSGDKASNELESCLEGNCSRSRFKSSKSFSIDDVVNLGIIDREEVRVEPAATGGQSVEPETLPSVDIEILFDYDSDELRSDQYPKLVELANLLKQEKFDAFRYAFLGHSDAKGPFDYNRELSERRARSVSRFVASVSGLPDSRMVAKGLGPSELKTPDDPFGASNRRVQLVLIPVN